MFYVSRQQQDQQGPARAHSHAFPPGHKGFTVLEVALAIGLGVIILAGITIGFSYGKWRMIVNNQQLEVNTFKTFIENARSAQLAVGKANFGPKLSQKQMCGIMQKIPSTLKDPYTGMVRGSTELTDCGIIGTESVFLSLPKTTTTIPLSPISKIADIPYSGIAGSCLFYMSCDTTDDPSCAPGKGSTWWMTFNLGDGSSVTVYGYAVFETDDQSNVVAVAGGDKPAL